MYQCCSEFTTLEDIREAPANQQPQYEFQWECLIDAQFSFKHTETESVKKKTSRCLFTRIYINDMKLLNKGERMEMKEPNKLLKKVCQLGYSADINFNGDIVQNIDDENQKTSSSYKDVFPFEIFDDVNFQEYPSKVNIGYVSSYKKRNLNNDGSTTIVTTGNSNENYDGSTQSYSIVDVNNTYDKNKEHQIVEEEQRPTIEQKLHYNFSYHKNRDERLVAKHAQRYFGNDKEMIKYWHQRYRFFTKLDKGCLLDREGWFSVTPELLARHVADRLVRIQDCTILDAFTGVGGNAIQFALRGAIVFAIDIDPIKLVCATQNARIYGASNGINFICGDFFHIAKAMFGAREAKEKRKIIKSAFDDPYFYAIDAVYLSPPWGGPLYAKDKDAAFDLKKSMALDGFEIFQAAKRISSNIVYYLPKETSVDQLIRLAGPGGRVELEQAMLNKKVKALNAYYGQLVLL